MHAWLVGTLVVGTVVALALGGMLLVRRSVGLSTLESHHEVAGFVYAVIGVSYAVLLGFAVVVVWEQYEDAAARAAREANGLADLLRGADAFPEPVRSRMGVRIRAYARAVIEEEWPAMARGEASPEAWAAFAALWRVYLGTEPRNDRERAWYAESLRRLDALSDDRRLRLLDSRTGLPGPLRVTLFLGAALTLGFSYLFGTRNLWSQALMTAALAGMVALILFLILALDTPFAGVARVGPDAFRELHEIFERWHGR